MLLELAEGLADLLERLVDGRDVPEDHDQLADGEFVLDDVDGADAEDEGVAEGRDRADREREERLPHRDLDPRVDGCLRLRPEAVVLVALAAERDDHPQHRHRLVDDRERAALEALDPVQLRLDPLCVVARGVVDERNDRQREQRELGVDRVRDREHPRERQDSLGERRDRDGDPAHRSGLVVRDT